MQFSYFFRNTPHLRVIIPKYISDVHSYNEMLTNGIKELFIIIPNLNGMIFHFSDIKFNSTIKYLNDVISLCDTNNFLEFGPDNIYLESNGVQILDNNGVLLFRQDVVKYLCTSESHTINEAIHNILIDLAMSIKFAISHPATISSTSVEALLKSFNKSEHYSYVDQLAGVNCTTQKKRINPYFPFRNKIRG